jgi:hypothetical protein
MERKVKGEKFSLLMVVLVRPAGALLQLVAGFPCGTVLNTTIFLGGEILFRVE